MPLKRIDPTKAQTFQAPRPKERPKAATKTKLPDFRESEYCSAVYPYVPRTLEAQCIPISEIKPDPKNPRINDKTSRELAKLIRQHGFRKAVVIDQNHVLKAGHTALKAAQILGMTHMPVSLSEFDEEQSVGYMVSDNRVGEDSEWDMNMLIQLQQAGAITSKEQIGFTDKEWKGLQLSDELPPELQSVEIKGETAETGDFLIIRFPDSGTLANFKEAFNMSKFERALDITTIARQRSLLQPFDTEAF